VDFVRRAVESHIFVWETVASIFIMRIMLDDLRRFTVTRNFFTPTTLKRALQRMEFVQADPIRAPARAQDLILRHRVKHYHAGDLERRYETLDIQEDFFVNYGFVTNSLQALMHPRSNCSSTTDIPSSWSSAQRKRARLLLEFVQQRGAAHPREVDEHFSHGNVKNYWGGSSNATTHLLDDMHYRGLLRIARREKGIRIYTAHYHNSGPSGAAARRARVDTLVDVVVRIYGPLPGPSLAYYVNRLRYAVPQWRDELRSALQRAKERLSHAHIDGVEWFWPASENALGHAPQETVRLLAPFDPLVHDRARFELLWNWVYRLEAYTPAHKRKLGYYAMPMLWRDQVIGWANLSVKDGQVKSDFGYVKSAPTLRTFKRELEAELDRIRTFLFNKTLST
jgi:uncharacterized protein YcaQ